MTIEPIGIIESCYGEKFGTPRQPGLCPSANGVIRLTGNFSHQHALRGLENFSHVWVIFQFHLIEKNSVSPTVRPPRLGGNDRMGVFASRSTHRPNPLGLSLCKIEKIEGSCVYISGHDLVHGTPVFDLKPYVKYAESIPDAHCSYADAPPEKLQVTISSTAQNDFDALEENTKNILLETLSLNPRPAFHDDETREYHVMLCGKNVSFRIVDEVVITKIR